jgi:hypothetical protein
MSEQPLSCNARAIHSNCCVAWLSVRQGDLVVLSGNPRAFCSGKIKARKSDLVGTLLELNQPSLAIGYPQTANGVGKRDLILH